MLNHALILVIFVSIFIFLATIYHHKYNKYRSQKDVLQKEKAFYAGLLKINEQTGYPLSNRLLFEDRLNHIIHHCERYEACFSLLMLEIDLTDHEITFDDNQRNRFRMDMLDHLKKNIRKVDTAIHFSDNTFLILLPKWYEPKTISYIVQRIQDNLMIPWMHDDKARIIHTNMGIVIYPDDGMELNELLEHVRQATEEAKLKGKDTYHFYQQAIQEKCDDDLQIISWLNHETFWDSFFVKYHTYVNMKTNQIEYLDVIPCIEQSERGIIQLMKYSHALERSGRLMEITEQLLIDSIKQWKRWQQDALQIKSIIIPLTINQLLNKELLYKLSHIITNYPLPPGRLIFELIPTNYSFDLSALEKITPILNKLPIKIAMNIFYFSQFSIEKVSKLPIKLLKIDNDVLKDLIASTDNIAILELISLFTKKMHIHLIADEVSSKKEIQMLQELGCHIMHCNMTNSENKLERETHRIEL